MVDLAFCTNEERKPLLGRRWREDERKEPSELDLSWSKSSSFLFQEQHSFSLTLILASCVISNVSWGASMTLVNWGFNKNRGEQESRDDGRNKRRAGKKREKSSSTGINLSISTPAIIKITGKRCSYPKIRDSENIYCLGKLSMLQ